MNEIAETTTHTALSAVESATSFPKVRHRAQLTIDRSRRIPPGVQGIASRLRAILVLESRIHVADEVVIVVVADDDFFDLAEFAHLAPEVFVEGVEVVLELGGVHLVLLVVGWVLVEVGEENCLAVGGLDMFSRAAVPVAACADLVVERAVDSVALSVNCFAGLGGGQWAYLSASVPKMDAR
jgi:hypothetical protein